MLQELQELKQAEQQQKADARERRRQQKMKEEAIARGEAVPESESDMEEEMDPGVIPKGDNATVLTHIINNSDVILEVVDARDPINSRCLSVEKAITEEMPEKVIIILLNKIDLVPRDVLAKTVDTLSKDFPVICFKNRNLASTSKFARNRSLGITKNPRDTEYLNYDFGNDYLLTCLRNLQQSRGEVLSVGVVGYPRVGRHSVIETLCKRSPLFQSDRQTYEGLNKLRRIDENIHLFVQPGEVVLMKREEGVCDYPFKCHAFGFEGIHYRELCLDLLAPCNKTAICYYYRVPMYKSVEEMVKGLEARQPDQKNLRNSTVPRQILSDWMSGALPHYAENEACALKTGDAKAVSEWKKAMGYAAVKKNMMGDEALGRLCSPVMPRTLVTPNIKPVEEELDMSCFLSAADKEESEEEEEEEEVPELVDADEVEDEALLE
ncbi:hypothetical protein WA577_004240 [Blastocystis sp. JDR]